MNIWKKQGRCPNEADCPIYPTLPYRRNRTEQNIYFIDLNSTVSRHTYFDITKDSYKVTIDVYMDLTTKL